MTHGHNPKKPPLPSFFSRLTEWSGWEYLYEERRKVLLVVLLVIGFVLGFRDLSTGLQRAKGRLWPVGWYYIFAERRRTRWINLNGLGLVPEHRGVGADAVLLTALDQTLRQAPFEHAYLVQVEEGNLNMVNQAMHLGVTWCTRHRSYQKAL